ncbi:GNAT family N-acetyltransferase [Shewanella frigidimarina]|uniref:GNAT family N-acetyltransferase n=1 Tax=Shewanella frigidimarina TaxID=56812 RepID=UPI003D795DA4
MKTDISFRFYARQDREACLNIFDDNCPEFFAPNERVDYADFLDSLPAEYEVSVLNGVIVGAYGLEGKEPEWRNLNWILISPKVQGIGIGSTFMNRVVSKGTAVNLTGIKIAASHLSAPFFAKYGALPIREIENGWGIGMHRIDMELTL